MQWKGKSFKQKTELIRIVFPKIILTASQRINKRWARKDMERLLCTNSVAVIRVKDNGSFSFSVS